MYVREDKDALVIQIATLHFRHSNYHTNAVTSKAFVLIPTKDEIKQLELEQQKNLNVNKEKCYTDVSLVEIEKRVAYPTQES